MLTKVIHNAKTGETTSVELSMDEVASIQQMQAELAAREALPKPGSDLLEQAKAATTVAGLRAVVVELITRVYGLQGPAPEPVVEPVEEVQP